ncbi:MAG: Phosphate-selective porin [Chitinophagaceae bacterium]|nr:Phosphate-selective porin [Chitinophagaceae bacterium]
MMKTKNSFLPIPSGRSVMLILLLSASTTIAKSQKISPDQQVTDTIQKPLVTLLKKLQVSGTIRMRYISSFQNNIDANGLEHSGNSAGASYSSNAFTIPQARIVVAGNITDKLDVYFRANFGDFAASPQNNVLEYAYATYHINPYLNIRAGLFKPEFGKEDDISTDYLQSFDYTNQYVAFGDNGWTNYQIGVSIMGNAKALGLPVSYAVGIFNGNGRNGFTDNDNGKQFPARVQVELPFGCTIGLSGGIGKDKGSSISAWGADLDYEKKINQRLELSVVTEYKEGSNQSLFFSDAVPGRSVSNYQLRGVYILPHIQYNINTKKITGLEASFKYEYLDLNFRLNGNAYQQYVPMLGINFAEEYAIRLQVGMLIDQYKSNIKNTAAYNSTRFITQLQVRF